MKIQIDQSGKIEQTNKNTVLAFSNKHHGTILLPGKEKRVIQDTFRKAGRPKMFTIQTFSACLYLLITKHHLLATVQVDKEYPGYENLIHNYLTQMFRNTKRKMPQVNFSLVGKECGAHHTANQAFRKKKGNYKLKAADILALVIILEKR